MANCFGAKLQNRLPCLAGVYPFSAPLTTTTCSSQKSRTAGERRAFGCRVPSRVALGLGISFISMARNVGAKSVVASARQKGEVEQVLTNVEWQEQFPFKDEDFQLFDESPDTVLYEMPRFVTHIDDQAIAALTKYHSEVLPGVAVLDMCSSWVIHYPAGYKQERIVGMGMNEEELKRNSVLTEYVVQDLNNNSKLPFVENTFDVVTNVEMSRILKPGGLAIMSFWCSG